MKMLLKLPSAVLSLTSTAMVFCGQNQPPSLLEGPVPPAG